MVGLTMENCNMTLLEKLKKHQPYHQAKLASMNILLVKKNYILVKNK